MSGYVVLIFTECMQTEYYLFLFADNLHHLTPFTMTVRATVETHIGREGQQKTYGVNLTDKNFNGHTRLTI